MDSFLHVRPMTWYRMLELPCQSFIMVLVNQQQVHVEGDEELDPNEVPNGEILIGSKQPMAFV
jgi:hypothetical protein